MKKSKMKLLDCTLISLLAGMPPMALSQESTARTSADKPAGDVLQNCTDEGCRSQEGLLFKLRTRSYDQPVSTGTSARSSSEALQPDRRVSVGVEQAGKAVVTGKFSVALPGGGAIWATEDPAMGRPELSISAPSMAGFDGNAITKPVQFYLRSNYAAFVARHELSIYQASDTDLVSPLATLSLEAANTVSTTWDGALPERIRLRAGDELIYVLRAYDAAGNFDETYPRTLQLVTPEEAERSGQILRNSSERFLGTGLSAEQAQTQALVDKAFAENGLRQQNIPIYGSRVRLQGRNLPAHFMLKINGDSHPVDLDRKFVAEFLVPLGQHGFAIDLEPASARAPEAPGPGGSGAGFHHTLNIDVSGRYFFGVGLADLTVTQNRRAGSSAAFANDDRYDDDIISDGRLAFYGKAKLGGRYLITAQADTTERDLQRLFSGFTQADPVDIFRRLDPNLYYPVYGDDSSIYRDVDTMGRFYLRVDWDKNQALWGNFHTGFTGTEYGQYVRSLYGAALDWRSRATNAWGDPGSELRAFGSQAQTAPGHSEFIGTGGSLYYLRHTDLLPGSDSVVLEVRDLTTGRVERRVGLQRGTDYEINELQGRLLLTRPLAQITRESVPTLTRDAPLDGFEQRLLVDYEWVPSGFDADDMTAGIRAKHWFGDHVGLGVTQVNEQRAGDDYVLSSADVTLQAGKGTYIKAEYSQTESYGAPIFFSDNGGFSFVQLNSAGPREGEAKVVEARANFKELGWSEQEWSAGAWWRDVGAGFSVSRSDRGQDITEYGAEVLGRFTPDLRFYARASKAERGTDALSQAQVSSEWRINETATLSGELRWVEEARSSGTIAGTLAAVRYAQRFSSHLELYATAQLTLDNDGGQYADNDALTLGGKYLFGDRSSVGAEVTTGDRGDAASVNAEYRLSPEHSFYGAYTFSTDSSGYDSLFNPDRQNGWTLGQRWRLSQQVNLFNESQYLKTPGESGLAHTFGMDFYPAQGWNLGFTLQDGELTNRAGGQIDRQAISVSGGRTSSDTGWQSKLEWRRDRGAEQREQWVSTNRFTHKINESWRVAARFNYSETEDAFNAAAGAKFVEGNAGFAWRPWNSTRWGLFGRYTYLYDLSTLGQLDGAHYDQKSRVVSLEGVYRLDQHWELAAKLARREGQVRFGRAAGEWADSATSFVAGQLRYDLRGQWHALAEYRWLRVKEGGTRKGWLLGLDRDINKNFRVGMGYNFTDFSNDLTDFNYDHRGWFLNMVGTY